MRTTSESNYTGWRTWAVLLTAYFILVPLLALTLTDSERFSMAQLQDLFKELALLGLFILLALIALVAILWKRMKPPPPLILKMILWILLTGPIGLARSDFLLTDENEPSP